MSVRVAPPYSFETQETLMTYETILTERKGDVLVITLNRPERLNAASIPLALD